MFSLLRIWKITVLFIYSFIHSFSSYVVSPSYVPSAIQEAGVKVRRKARQVKYKNSCSTELYRLTGKMKAMKKLGVKGVYHKQILGRKAKQGNPKKAR